MSYQPADAAAAAFLAMQHGIVAAGRQLRADWEYLLRRGVK